MKPGWLFGTALLVALASHSACADERADRLLEQVQSNLAQLKTCTVEFSGTFNDSRPQRNTSLTFSGTLRFMKPNFAKINYSEAIPKSEGTAIGGQATEAVSDGSNFWVFDLNQNEYRVEQVYPDGGNIEVSHHLPAWMFFSSRVPHTEVPARFAGVETTNGETFQVIEFRQDDPADPAKPPLIRQRLYIGTDNLVHRYINEQVSGKYVDVCELRYTHANEPMAVSNFTWHPPVGAVKQISNRPPTLAPGTPAPDFKVNDAHGRPVKLSDFRGKVVVLDFWATWCGPCIEALPEENALSKKFGDNVVMLALDVWDKPEAFNHWLSNNKQYDALTFATDPSAQGEDVGSKFYLVKELPAVYVIGRDGKIVNGSMGYDPQMVETSIKSAAQAK